MKRKNIAVVSGGVLSEPMLQKTEGLEGYERGK